MMKSVESKIIGGHKYTGHYIPASKACKIAFKLVTFLSGGNKDISNLIGENDDNLMLNILSYTLREGVAINQANFDNIYTGNLKELAEALLYAGEANFGDFLPVKDIGLGKGLKRTKTKITRA